MDLMRNKEKGGGRKKGLMFRTWERCRSFGSINGKKIRSTTSPTRNRNIRNIIIGEDAAAASAGGGKGWIKKSRSWPNSGRVAPEGCFWVCVGEEKQKFCIKTQCLNHPLFKMLLEEAESEYGFTNIDGPVELPCEVEMFIKVLVEMDDGDDNVAPPPRCSFNSASRSSSSASSYHVLPSPRFLPFNKIY